MNQGRYRALSPRSPLPSFNHFMLLNNFLWAGAFAYSRSYFSMLWRLTSPRWRCCRFSVGPGLFFCVKTVLLSSSTWQKGQSVLSYLFLQGHWCDSNMKYCTPPLPKKKKTHGREIPQRMALLRDDGSWGSRHHHVSAWVRKRWELIGGCGPLGIGIPLNSMSCSEALPV